MNFKQCQKIGEVETIAQENEINKENFMEILMDKFTDKTKTIRQILKQLKRMVIVISFCFNFFKINFSIVGILGSIEKNWNS